MLVELDLGSQESGEETHLPGPNWFIFSSCFYVMKSDLEW
jgi:hypothetical protein